MALQPPLLRPRLLLPPPRPPPLPRLPLLHPPPPGPVLSAARTPVLLARGGDSALLREVEIRLAVALVQRGRGAVVVATLLPRLLPLLPRRLHQWLPPLKREAAAVIRVRPALPVSPRANPRLGLPRPGHPPTWPNSLWFLTRSTQCGLSSEPCPPKLSPEPLRLSPRNICEDRVTVRCLTALSHLRLFE